MEFVIVVLIAIVIILLLHVFSAPNKSLGKGLILSVEVEEEPVVDSVWEIPLSNEKLNDPFRESSSGVMMKILRTQKGNNGEWYVEYCYKGSDGTWMTDLPHSESYRRFREISKRV